MENNSKKLKVQVNLRSGEYVFQDENGLYAMSITDEDKDIQNVKKVRDELIEIYCFPEALAAKVDTILYSKLMEYDKNNKTNYLEKYLNVIAKEVTRKEGEKKSEFDERCKKVKGEALQASGIELDYNIGIVGASKKLSLLDRIKMMFIARKQKQNGANVDIHLTYSDEAKAIEEHSRVITESPKDKEIILEELQTEISVEPEKIVTDNDTHESISEDIVFEELTVDPMEEDNTKSDGIEFDSIPETTEEPEVVFSEENDERGEKTEVSSNSQQTTEDKKKQSHQFTESKPKKTISRQKAIQASKRELRESRKMKNVYKQKIAAKSDRTTSAKTSSTSQKPKQRQPEVYKAKHKTPVKPVTTKATTEAKKEQTVSTAQSQKKEVTTDVISKLGNKFQRFTRKLKSEADSIKNKVYVHKDKFRKLAISGAIGIVAIAAVGGLTYGAYSMQSQRQEVPQMYETEVKIDVNAGSTVEELSGINLNNEIQPSFVVGKADTNTAKNLEMGYNGSSDVEVIDDIAVETVDTKTTTDSEVSLEDTSTEENVDSVETPEEAIDKKDSSAEYLSSIRVGSKLNIESGRYFETPEGTGKSGSFENYKDSSKEINIIGILTNEGYIVIEDESISLYELKQQYPNAKFSYHIISRSSDGTTKVLGWMTENSIEQNREQNEHQIDNEER